MLFKCAVVNCDQISQDIILMYYKSYYICPTHMAKITTVNPNKKYSIHVGA